METITLDILNPQALALLKNLEAMNLIRLREVGNPPSEETPNKLLKYKGAMKKQPLAEIETQLKAFVLVIGLNDEVKNRTIAIRKQNGLKLPDAMIAATALTMQLPLMTRNLKDFKGIEDLEVVNPFEQ